MVWFREVVPRFSLVSSDPNAGCPPTYFNPAAAATWRPASRGSHAVYLLDDGRLTLSCKVQFCGSNRAYIYVVPVAMVNHHPTQFLQFPSCSRGNPLRPSRRCPTQEYNMQIGWLPTRNSRPENGEQGKRSQGGRYIYI